MHAAPQKCPICDSRLIIQELRCDHCHTTVKGRFKGSKLTALSEEQLHFVETFIKVRGSIKEMEKELNISYPTVRNRLEQVIEALGYQSEKLSVDKARRQEILDQLGRGEISSEEAIQLLNE